eukprot:5891664-Amphidinium_carterae.1
MPDPALTLGEGSEHGVGPQCNSKSLSCKIDPALLQDRHAKLHPGEEVPLLPQGQRDHLPVLGPCILACGEWELIALMRAWNAGSQG